MRHSKNVVPAILFRLLIASLLAPATACVDSSDPLGAPNVIEVGTVASVNLTLAQPVLALGQSTQATVVAKLADGSVVNGSIDFSSQNPSIATVSSKGVVSAVAAGIAVIQAAMAGRVASTSVTVQSADPPPVVTDSGVLAFSDFNNGSTGPYTGLSTDVNLISDPTGSGRGNVVRMHYAGTNQDRNRSVEYKHAVHFGQTIYSKGDFYIPVADLGDGFFQRKLLYWFPHIDYSKYGGTGKGGPVIEVILVAFGTDLKAYHAYVDHNGVLQGDVMHLIAQLTGNRWYVVETQLTMESSIGAGDGIYRVWLDGTLIYETTTLQLTDPGWIGQPTAGGNRTPLDLADVYMERFDVGDQAQWSGTFDEYRYWDNIGFSNTRIRP